jgi:putative nucleotidyltransferase with HDIG domain
MIDLEKAKNEFINYTNNYDLTDNHITRKIYHSLRVMEISKKIAENLNLTQEQIELATLIGLLHDIARFEQRKRYGTYYDKKSIDHGDLAVELLEENNLIRLFIEDNKYDKIIKTAIKNHNKYEIEPLEGEELLQSKIIKDADKIDIFFQLAYKFAKNKEAIENSDISEYYIEQLKKGKCILRDADESAIDELVLITSFIYDIHFDYSLKFIKNEKYIEKMFEQFNFNKNTKNQVEEIIKIANDYLEKY